MSCVCAVTPGHVLGLTSPLQDMCPSAPGAVVSIAVNDRATSPTVTSTLTSSSHLQSSCHCHKSSLTPLSPQPSLRRYIHPLPPPHSLSALKATQLKRYSTCPFGVRHHHSAHKAQQCIESTFLLPPLPPTAVQQGHCNGARGASS